MRVVIRLIREDCGAALIEYALLAGLVAIVAIAGVNGVASTMSSMWSGLNAAIRGVP